MMMNKRVLILGWSSVEVPEGEQSLTSRSFLFDPIKHIFEIQFEAIDNFNVTNLSKFLRLQVMLSMFNREGDKLGFIEVYYEMNNGGIVTHMLQTSPRTFVSSCRDVKTLLKDREYVIANKISWDLLTESFAIIDSKDNATFENCTHYNDLKELYSSGIFKKGLVYVNDRGSKVKQFVKVYYRVIGRPGMLNKVK